MKKFEDFTDYEKAEHILSLPDHEAEKLLSGMSEKQRDEVLNGVILFNRENSIAPDDTMHPIEEINQLNPDDTVEEKEHRDSDYDIQLELGERHEDGRLDLGFTPNKVIRTEADGTKVEYINTLKPFELGSTSKPIDDNTANDVKILPFPVEILPKQVQNLISHLSGNTRAVPDFMGGAYLTLVGALIGTNYKVEIPGYGWKSNGLMWAAFIAKKGQAKSPSIDPITAPLWDKANKEISDYNYSMSPEAFASVNRRVANVVTTDIAVEEQPDNIEDIKPINVLDEIIESVDMKEVRNSKEYKEWRSEAQAKNPYPKFIMGDTSYENMVIHLQYNDLLQLHDELDGFISSMSRYHNDTRAAHLSLWDNKGINYGRKGNTKAERSEIVTSQSSAPLMGTIQPAILSSILDDPKMHGSGFIDRFLMHYPTIVEQPINLTGVAGKETKAYAKHISKLYDDLRLDHGHKPTVYNFSKDSLELLTKYDNELNSLSFSSDNPMMEGHYIKLSKYIGRFALILHVLRSPDDELIGSKCLTDAWELVQYYKDSAAKVYLHNSRHADLKFLHTKAKRTAPSWQTALLLNKQGFSYREIAEISGKTVDAIGMSISRAKSKVRKMQG